MRLDTTPGPHYPRCTIKQVGAQHIVMGTDLGQTGNPGHIDGMKAMVSGLKANGCTDQQIKMVARDNVAAMLGL